MCFLQPEAWVAAERQAVKVLAEDGSVVFGFDTLRGIVGGDARDYDFKGESYMKS